jgi:hypothetical protein
MLEDGRSVALSQLSDTGLEDLSAAQQAQLVEQLAAACHWADPQHGMALSKEQVTHHHCSA